MRLLLDTHAFIWWDNEPEKLSRRVLELCQDSHNQVFLSVASIWEIQIKLQLGKIKLDVSLQEMVESQQEANNLTILSVQAHHVFELAGLPDIHKDPFDRMIVAQTKTDGLRLLTHDPVMKKYPVIVDW